MGKNNIIVPSSFDFQTNIPVRITDINYGGHLGNDSVLSIAHEARMQFLSSLGFSEMNFGGVSLIMSELAVDFKAELMYGDTAIIGVAVSDISKVTFDLVYQIKSDKNGKHIVAANIRTGMVCFDYETKRIRPIPEGVLKIIKP
ncbi:thioesterase family protein [Pollutibacter soli]|uniref:acyl-CoA thioesterase n=1 Tax=Pollutibacter soli TaxID=3034157 RepID=UPI00301419D9